MDSFKTELIADRGWRARSQLAVAIVDTSAGSTPSGSTQRSTTGHQKSSRTEPEQPSGMNVTVECGLARSTASTACA